MKERGWGAPRPTKASLEMDLAVETDLATQTMQLGMSSGHVGTMLPNRRREGRPARGGIWMLVDVEAGRCTLGWAHAGGGRRRWEGCLGGTRLTE